MLRRHNDHTFLRCLAPAFALTPFHFPFSLPARFTGNILWLRLPAALGSPTEHTEYTEEQVADGVCRKKAQEGARNGAFRIIEIFPRRH